MRNKAVICLLVTMAMSLGACGKVENTPAATVVANTKQTTVNETEQVTVEETHETETSSSSSSLSSGSGSGDALNIDKSEEDTSTEEKYNQVKTEWIQEKMNETINRFNETSMGEQDTVYLNIDNNMIEFPIIGNDLTILGFTDERIEESVDSWAETNGDIREKNGIALNIGYLNNTDKKQSRNECYIGYLKPEDNEHISIFFQGSELIKPGTSLVDLVSALQEHGFEMAYTLGSQKIAGLDLAEANAGDTVNTVLHSDSDGTWTVCFASGSIDDFEPVAGKSKHATDEMRKQFTQRICQSNYTVTGNDKEGLLEIRYDYSYIDCETLGKIYDGFNK